MSHFLDLFTPEAWRNFRATESSITGFRPRQRRTAIEDVSPGDYLLCYLTRISRWCGVLRVTSSAFEDSTPIHGDPDPFTIRFRVEPLVVLDPDESIPIHTPDVWNRLSMTRQYSLGHKYWSGFFRKSLNLMTEQDGEFLIDLLTRQKASPTSYPLTRDDQRKLEQKSRVPAPQGSVEVEIPEDDSEEDTHLLPSRSTQTTVSSSDRESTMVQARVAEIGAKMNFQVWVPRNDRNRVLEHVQDEFKHRFIDELPLNYEENTLRTIEQIDVLWLERRSMVRAFEIEHTTAIYSGLLRMADLLALQPNMDIRLSIVAPEDKRDKVLQQIKRPVFSLLERGPLYEQCSYLSYDSIQTLGRTEFLAHMNDTVVTEYEEFAEA